jgi:hypothetical protein
MVARDGIEPPTPAFSGPPSNGTKWSGISGCRSRNEAYGAFSLGLPGTNWGVFACTVVVYWSCGLSLRLLSDMVTPV